MPALGWYHAINIDLRCLRGRTPQPRLELSSGRDGCGARDRRVDAWNGIQQTPYGRLLSRGRGSADKATGGAAHQISPSLN